MHEIAIFVVPGTLVLLELPAGAELFADAEDTGENALRRDLQIGGEEGAPVEVRQAAALGFQDVIDGGDHQVEVLLPINEAGGRLFPLAAMTRINEVSKCLEGSCWILRSVYIEHPDQGFGFIRVSEIRIIKHGEDLKNNTEVGADGEFVRADLDFCWQVKHKDSYSSARRAATSPVKGRFCTSPRI